MDESLPEILISNSEAASEVMKQYHEIREEAFKACFRLIGVSIEQYVKNSSPSQLLEIKNTLLMLARLADMKYFMTYVYWFSRFLWGVFTSYKCHPEVRRVSLFSLSTVSMQLVKFLLWQIDNDNNEQFRDLALEIFDTLKADLINGEFLSDEIVYVLNVLDVHDRFIGQYIDAVPENMFLDGYVICSLQNGALENDDVYEDYERFSATNGE